MPQVELTQQDDETLERLAPSYLGGKQLSSRRVRWAVAELAARMRRNAAEEARVPEHVSAEIVEEKARRLYDERVGTPDGKNTACREEDARFGATVGDKVQRARQAEQADAEEGT